MRIGLVALFLVGLVVTRAEAGRGSASLKYLPDDTRVVLVSDVARARGSQIFKKLFQLARDQVSELDALASAQPLDKLVDTVVIGANADKAIVAVLEGRVDKLFEEAKKRATKSETHAGVTYWVTPDFEVALIDKRLVLAASIAAVIDRAQDKKAKAPATVRTLFAAAGTGTAVFGGAMLDSDAKQDLATKLGAEPQWVTYAIGLAHKLTFDLRAKLADEAAATTAVKTLGDQLTPDRRGQLETFVGKEFADSITIDQQQATARVAATMSAEEIDKIITFVQVLM